MAKIKTSDLKEGMKFDKPVYIDGNNLFIPPNIPIKQKDIDRLLRWEISEVQTEGNRLEDVNIDIDREYYNAKDKGEKDKEINIYINLIERLEKAFTDIIEIKDSNKVFDKSRIDSIAKDIINEINRNPNEIIQFIFLGGKNINKLPMMSVNCAILSGIIGKNLKLPHFRLIQLVTGAMLHDIGMLKVPKDFLAKKEKLAEDELKTIRMHTLHSYNIVLNEVKYSEDVAKIVLYHHEKWNGTGYPKNLKEEDIPLAARIVAVADVFEALVNERSYRSALTGYNAIKNLLSDNGTHFDPGILKIFFKCIGIYPIGSYVRLNNGAIGKVIQINAKAQMRPKLQIVRDKFGNKLKEKKIIDLKEIKEKLFIVEAIKLDDL